MGLVLNAEMIFLYFTESKSSISNPLRAQLLTAEAVCGMSSFSALVFSEQCGCASAAQAHYWPCRWYTLTCTQAYIAHVFY